MATTMYSELAIFGLRLGHNTRIGEIRDGDRRSKSRYSWDHGHKHGVHDGSIHYHIVQFLKTQPDNQATIQAIIRAVPKAASMVKRGRPDNGFLRELVKQEICMRI